MAAIGLTMHRYSLLLALLLAAPTPALAGDDGYDGSEDAPAGSTIYKTVGPDGKVTFSDTPPAGKKAEPVELKHTNVQPIALPRQLPVRKLSPRDQEREEEYLGPINFAIVSPQDGATIVPGERFIVLEVAVDPVPRGGYEFFAVVDGQPWAGTSSGTSLDISALDRGTHNIQAVLLDLGGNVLARSQIVQIHVKRPGGTLPDNSAPQAVPAPQAPVAPGVPQQQQTQQQRRP